MVRRFRHAALFFSALLCACSSMDRADHVGASPHDRIDLREVSLAPGEVHKIGGYVGERLEANKDGLIKPFAIDDYLKLLEEKKYRDWFWVGEQPGKWLESASLLCTEFPDAGLNDEVTSVLGRMEGAQERSGYLGVTDPAVRTPKQPLRGMDAYELYFTMHGLMTAYETRHDARALAAAKRLGDYFIATIGPGKAEFWPSDLRPPANIKQVQHGHSELAGHSVHYGWEGALLEDPMLRLYELTGEKRYLDWSDWAIRGLDRWGGWNTFSRLDDVAAGKISLNALQPVVHAHTFNMAFLGFLRMYRITGDPMWLRKVSGARDDIEKSRVYVTGGVSVAEHYDAPFHLPLTGKMVETCASMSWMQMNQSLLEISADPRYADAIETLMLNHVFAAQAIDGDSFRYFTPPNGFQPSGLYRDRPDCCFGSGHRLLSMLPGFFYAREDNGLVINQYVSSDTSIGIGGSKFAVAVATDYPSEETIRIRVTSAPPGLCTLKLRIPAWCKAATIAAQGRPPQPAPAANYAVLTETWNAGDEIVLTLPMELSWKPLEHWEGTEPAPWYLSRGPVVYALDTVWWDAAKSGPAPADVSKDVIVMREVAPREIPPTPRARGTFYAVQVRLPDGRQTEATMVPFTNLGQWYREGEPKPDKKSQAFSYAMGLQTARSGTAAAAAGVQSETAPPVMPVAQVSH